MTMIKNTAGQYPTRMTGTVTLTATPGTQFTIGNWAYVGTWGSETFKGKVIKASGAEITVKQISGTLTSAASLKERVAGGGSDTAAAGTVSTVNATNVGGVNVNTGGWNLRETDHGITRSKKQGSRYTVEVLVAQKGMSTVRTDFATVATFTLTGGAWSAATTYDVSNGDVITLTIKSSEPVRLPAGSTYAITVGATGRTATYTGSSTNGLDHTFAYAVAAGDIGSTSASVTTGNLGLNGGTAYEVADNGSVKALTAPIAVGGSLATKSGITIQA